MRVRSTNTGIPRPIEAILSAAGLAIFSPLLFVAGLLTKAGSEGPVLFRQQRVGCGGKLFTLLKFRTMTFAANGPLITAAGDSRVTAVGRLLRKTKIDELPELWNVMLGEMSLVGPRPEVPEMVDLDDVRWNEVLAVRPGITDPVTLRFRNEERFLADVSDKERFYSDVLQPYKLQGYIEYLRRRTWKSDVSVIFRTLKAIVFPQTALPPTYAEIAGGTHNADLPQSAQI